MNAVESTTTRLINKAAGAILILYGITTIHHIYGGIVDSDPKRLFVPVIAAIPLLISLGALRVYRRTGSKAALN